MKKALSIAGILALSITPTASFADHLEPRESEIRRNGNGNLEHTNLRGQSLIGANLTDANLTDADLSDADLSGADLSGADLTDANLSLARLKRANLVLPNWMCHLSGADLGQPECCRPE